MDTLISPDRGEARIPAGTTFGPCGMPDEAVIDRGGTVMRRQRILGWTLFIVLVIIVLAVTPFFIAS